jgi:hypothetical protein
MPRGIGISENGRSTSPRQNNSATPQERHLLHNSFSWKNQMSMFENAATEASCLAFVYETSLRVLTETKAIQLGTLVEALVTTYDLDLAVDLGIRPFYEKVLFRLEKEHGPLVCNAFEGSDEDAELWGYADTIEEVPPARAPGDEPTPDTVVAWFAERVFSLSTGHPDSLVDEGCTLPSTIWRCAA